MFFSKLNSLKDTIKIIDDNQKIMGNEVIPLREAHKRVLAENIESFHDSPPFDKSAMDGFAVKGEDTFGASNSFPKTLKIIDSIGAGVESKKMLKK